MTRETKVGIAMVLLLVGVFGFLVYKRFTRPIDAMAENEQQAADEDGDAPDGDLLALQEGGEFPVAGNTRQIPQDEPSDVDDPFGGAAESPASTAAAPRRPKLPTMIADDEPEADRLGAFVSETAGDETAVRSDAPDLEGDDPFLDSPGAVSSSAPKAVSSPPTMQFDEADAATDESFATDPAPVVRAPAVAPPVINSRAPEFDEPDSVTVQARAKRPEPTFDFGDDASEEQTPELAAEPARRATNSPVPRLMLDDSDEDRYGGYEPIELVDNQTDAELMPTLARGGDSRSAPKTDFFQAEQDGRRTAVTIAGDSHVVQPGENFWSISQKKYGTGRYFQALAAYNQRQIPDATKMKSGVTVALPAADELERRYPNLIPQGGPSEPAAADGQANLPGELLTGQDGRPLYRIGARDTLSGISQKYLGRSSRWMQIFEMNRDVLKDGNSLKVGAVLRLPTDAGELQLSNQPRAFR